MRVSFSSAVQILLLDDLALSLSIGLCLDFRQPQFYGRVLVVPKHCLINEASIHLVNCDLHWLRMVCIKRKLANAEALKIMLVSQAVIFSLLIVIADRGDVEELDVVLEANPEAPIIFVLQIHLALRGLRPLRRFVAPIALPFFATPRVPDLNQPFSLTVIESDDFGCDQTISVRIN